MKIVIAPDSYKGTYTAAQIAEAVKAGCLDVFKDAEIITIPMADGGEGTLEALGCGLVKDRVTSVFPGEYTDCTRGKAGNRAFIEMARCAGLPLAGDRKNPLAATTYGVGEMILHALNEGTEEIILTLGGSATNDLGCGMAAALGVRFTDAEGKEFIPVGGTLSDIAHIDMSGIDERIKNVKITAMCDVKNPLYGEHGAAYVFARQKGASDEDIVLLDDGLRHCSDIIRRELGIDISSAQGAGAAGGMGGAVIAFLGGELKSGIECILDAADFDGKAEGADIVFTGEGRFDGQSLDGKVVSGVAKRSKLHGVPCAVIAGSCDTSFIPGTDTGITAVFSCQSSPRCMEEAFRCTESDVRYTAANIMRAMFCGVRRDS